MTAELIEPLRRLKAGVIRHRRLLLILSIALGVGVFALPPFDKKNETVHSFVPESPPAQAAKRPKLVATFRDLPPDLVVYSEGRHSGAMRYVLEDAAARVGYAIQWKQLPFSNSLAGLADGSVDIVPSAHHKTPEREKEARFSVSLGRQSRPIFFALHQEQPGEIKSIADLGRHSIGYLENAYYFPEFHASTLLTKVAYADMRGMMQGFIKGEVDVVVLNNKKSVERELAALGYSKYRYADLSVNDDPDAFFLYSRNSQKKEIFDRLDQAFVQMKNEGLIADIYHSFDAEPPK